MIHLHPSDARGRSRYEWLDARHSFSFGEYYDPDNMGFRSLRVLNEDRVRPDSGFPPHGHQEMEILTYVIEGSLQHKDSLGNGSVLRPGDVQVMSAGTGIRHSEWNPSSDEELHLLQIWLLPGEREREPGWDEKTFEAESRQGTLRLIASPDGSDGSLTLHQDARVFATLLEAGDRVVHDLEPGRHAWVQVVRGALTVNGEALGPGDAAALSQETRVEIAAGEPSELLLFDLA